MNDKNLLILIICFLLIILLTNIIFSQNFDIPEIDKLQSGYKAVQNPDGTITITAPGTGTEYNELNINGHEFSLFPEAKLIINKDKNEVKTEGTALIIINEGKPNQHDLGIINDATIKLNEENNIIKAIFKPDDDEFIRDKEKVYDFNYKNKDGQTSKYIFSVRKGGKVVFDPENNIIEGKNTELSYEIENKLGIKERQIIGAESFKLTLENGNLKQLTIEKGILKLKLFGGAQEFIADRLTFFFDGTNIKDFEGNAISIDQTNSNNRKINIKGEITGNNLKGSLNYKGISKNTYTEFYYDGKPNKDGTQDPENIPYFDVQQGIAELNNEKHKILIQDGRALLQIKNGNRKEPTSFKFDIGEEGKETIGFIDEENNKYQLTAFKENGKTITTEIFLDALSPGDFIESEKILAKETQIKDIKFKYQDALSEIKNQIASGKFTANELQQLQLAEIITQNKLDIINEKDIIDSRLRLEKFLQNNLYPEIKANAQIILGELRLEELRDLKASYGSPLAQTISEKARNDFRDAINYFDKQLKYSGLDEETKKRLINIRDQAQLNIGKSYLNDNRPLAESEFIKLLNPELKEIDSEIRSEANRLFGLSRFAQNPQGQSQFALQYLKKAIDENPNNILAKQNLRDLELLLIEERKSEYYKESGEQLQDVLDVIGKGSSNKFLDIAKSTAFDPVITPYHALSGRLDEILKQQEQQLTDVNRRIVGSSGIKSIIANGIEVNDYTTSANRQRLSMISRLNGFDSIISSQDLLEYSEELKLGFDKSTRAKDMSELLSRIAQDKGVHIADKYFEDLNKATILMDSVDFTIKTDPRMYLISGHGYKLSTNFLEDESKLLNAFETDRSGNKIERTWTEFGLETADIVGGAFLAGGVTRIIGAGAKAIGATKLFDIGRISLAPVETVVLNTIGKNAPKTAVLLGIGGEAITQTGISYGLTSINSEVGIIYDLVSLGGGAKTGIESIVKLSDPLGNEKIIQLVNDDLYKKLKGSSDIKVHFLESPEIPKLYRNKFPKEGINYEEEIEIAIRRYPGRIGDVSDNVKEDGLFYYGEKPADGRFMWVIDEDGDFTFAYLNHPGLKDIIHPDLARGKRIYGAGEFDVIDGKYELNPYIIPKTGHYVDLTDPNFDKNVIDAFEERARGIGWRSVDESFDDVLIDNNGNIFARKLEIPPNFREVRRFNVDNRVVDLFRETESEEVIKKYFTPDEFYQIHPELSDIPTYHNGEHTARVSQLAGDFASARELSPRDTKFITQVALLHDIDPFRKPGTPARVPNTIELLEMDFQRKISLTGEKGKSILRDKFDWTENDLLKAKAMIQRTEFPFTNQHPNSFYKDMSPVERYKEFLQKLNSEDREFVLREGYLLSEYSDKCSYYCGSFDKSVESVRGLANEINTAVGKEVINIPKLETQRFLASIGEEKSFEFDKRIAKELEIIFSPLTREEAFNSLSGSYKSNFEANIVGFEKLNGELANGKNFDEALDAGRKAFRHEISKSNFNLEDLLEVESREIRDRQKAVSDLVVTGENFEEYILDVFGPGTNFLRNRGVESEVKGLERLIDDVSTYNTIRIINPNNLNTAIGSSKISQTNFNKIFTYQYKPDNPTLKGAKAIVYIDEDGIYHTRFWSSGEGKVLNNIHHRDALSDLINQEADRLIKRGYLSNDESILNLGSKREDISKEISSNRRQSSIPDDILEKSQGFQIILDEKSGKIIEFNIDSGITSAQISRGKEIDAEKLSEMIRIVHESIDPVLRDYDVIGTKKLFLDQIRGQVKLPSGLRIREILE